MTHAIPADPTEAQGAWLVLADEVVATALAMFTSSSSPIVVCSSAEAFERSMHDRSPRVVIIQTPPAGDAAIAAALRERQRSPSVRLLLLNEPAGIEGRLAALRQGFNDALPVTASPAEIVGRVRLLVGRSRERNGTRSDHTRLMVTPDTELDRAAHRIRQAGHDVHLRPKEFALLALLASHPGRVFSRRELIARVWGPDFSGDQRTVDVHVRWIRSKIEADAEHPAHLITVRGSGYRLDPPGI